MNKQKRKLIDAALAGRIPRKYTSYEFDQHMKDCHQCAMHALKLTGAPCDGWRMFSTQPKYTSGNYDPRLWEACDWAHVPDMYDGENIGRLVFVGKCVTSLWVEIVSLDGSFGDVVYHSYSDCE